MRAKGSLPPAYFEGMYAKTADPWGFETSPYERSKYDRTIAALEGRRYAAGLEVGCANGVLTRRLSGHVDTLLAVDISQTAVERAGARCADLGSVDVRRMAFPFEAPQSRSFDLVVMSEVVYYWDDDDIVSAGDWLNGHLARDGDLLLVHWIRETDYPQTGDDAVAKLRRALAEDPCVVAAERTGDYRLDLWRRR